MTFFFGAMRPTPVQDPTVAARQAKALAATQPAQAARFVRKCRVLDQVARFEIAAIAAAAHGGTTSEHIKDFGITDQAARIKIATIAAQQDAAGTSKYIKNYNITDREGLTEVVMAAALNRGGGVSKYIKEYDIKDHGTLVAVALAAAQHNARSLSEHITNFRFRDAPTLISIATAAAKSDGFAVSRYIKNYGISDVAELVNIAKLAVAQSTRQTINNIKNYGLQEEKDLLEIAKVAANHSGWSTSDLIGKFNLKSEQSRIEVAKLSAAKDGWHTSEMIKNYDIQSNAALIEIAKISAAQDGWNTSIYIMRYGITDQNALFEIATLAFAHHPRYAAEYIAEYGLTNQAHLVELAKVAAAKSSEGMSRFIRKFGISDEADRVAIARIAAATDGGGVSKSLENYDITSQQELVEIAKIAALSDPGGTSEYIRNYGITSEADRIAVAQVALERSIRRVPPCIQNYEITDHATLLKMARFALSKSLANLKVLPRFGLPNHLLDGELLCPMFSKITGDICPTIHLAEIRILFGDMVSSESARKDHGIPNHDWEHLEPHQKVMRIAEWFSALYTRATGKPMPLADSIEVQAEELIYKAVAATIAFWNMADVERYGTRARATLALISGYDSIPTGQLSSTACRELWGSLLAARVAFGIELPSEVPVRLDANRPQALRVLTLAIALKSLGGKLPVFNEPIDSNGRFQAAEELLTKRLTEEFRACLSIHELEDSGAVTRLWDRWGGDLTPLFVLAGRFKECADWRSELPVLSEVAQRCLNNSFHDWRYRGDDGQLGMLSERQLLGWRKNPCQISLISPSATTKDSPDLEQLNNLNNIFSSNLLQHLPQAVAVEVRSTSLTADELDHLLTMGERAFSRQPLTATLALIRHTLELGDLEKIRKAIALTNGAKATLLEQNPDLDRKQISEDLKSMNDASKRLKAPEGSEYYVISVITDDPKLLLMTGDLVQSASCQNYKTGGYAHTLPGYVIDGNIKLALSYVVKKGFFERLKEPNLDRLIFDPAMQSLRTQDGSKNLTLGYAVRREILRLGTSNKEIVCVVERPYLQTHAISSQIADHQRALIAAHLKAAEMRQAKKGDTATFPASRNPAGVYTDKGAGVKRGCYTITLNE